RKWTAAHSRYLSGKDVVILPDNDADGQAHCQIVVETLNGIVASLRVVNLPDLPEKGDVTDWKENGGTVDQLHALVDSTAPHQPGAPPPPGDDQGAFRVNNTGLYVEVVRNEKPQFARVGPPLAVTARTRNFEGDACGKQVRFR